MHAHLGNHTVNRGSLNQRIPDANAVPTIAIETQRGLQLRLLRAADLCALADALADTTACDCLYFEGLGEAHVEAAGWLRWRQAGYEAGRALALAAFDADDRLLGEVSLDELRPADAPLSATACRVGQLSYWVRASQRGQGHGVDMTRALCHYAFQHLGVSHIEMSISAANQPSLQLAHRLGARQYGRGHATAHACAPLAFRLHAGDLFPTGKV